MPELPKPAAPQAKPAEAQKPAGLPALKAPALPEGLPSLGEFKASTRWR